MRAEPVQRQPRGAIDTVGSPANRPVSCDGETKTRSKNSSMVETGLLPSGPSLLRLIGSHAAVLSQESRSRCWVMLPNSTSSDSGSPATPRCRPGPWRATPRRCLRRLGSRRQAVAQPPRLAWWGRCSGCNGGEGGAVGTGAVPPCRVEAELALPALRNRADGVQHLFVTDSHRWNVNRVEVEVPGPPGRASPPACSLRRGPAHASTSPVPPTLSCRQVQPAVDAATRSRIPRSRTAS